MSAYERHPGKTAAHERWRAPMSDRFRPHNPSFLQVGRWWPLIWKRVETGFANSGAEWCGTGSKWKLCYRFTGATSRSPGARLRPLGHLSQCCHTPRFMATGVLRFLLRFQPGNLPFSRPEPRLIPAIIPGNTACCRDRRLPSPKWGSGGRRFESGRPDSLTSSPVVGLRRGEPRCCELCCEFLDLSD